MALERTVGAAIRWAALPVALLAASCDPAQIDGASDDGTRSVESACPSHRLWVAHDGATALSSTKDYWSCLLDHSNFGALASGYRSGRALGLGGVATLAKPCPVVHAVRSASVSSDSSALQCIIDQTGWDVGPDDVVLYYPKGYGCQDGRNHWSIPVTSHGRQVKVEAAFVFASTSAECQEAMGSHEVYEASAQASAADCCNGQAWTGCAPHPGPYGWYRFDACGGTWWAQEVSPAGHEYDGAYCTRLRFSSTTCSGGAAPAARPTPGTVQALGKCMDVSGSHTSDGTHVQLWSCNGTSAQSFSLGDGGDIVTRFATCVDVSGGDPAPGTRVQEWSCNGSGAQQWRFDPASLRSALGKCLDVPNDGWTAGQAVQLYDCNGTAAQKLAYDPYLGHLHASGLCLTVAGGLDANGTRIELEPCGSSASQEWRPSGGALHSGLDHNRCLDVSGSATANGTRIQLWDCNGTEAQQWALQGPIHGVGGGCLDVPSSNTSDGNQLQIWSCNGTGAQDWTFWLP